MSELLKQENVSLDERLAKLEKLLVDNAWELIVGEGIHDGLYSNGNKSIISHNTPERFVLSVMYNNVLISKYKDIDQVLSDGLLIYFIQEYYEI